MPEKQPIKLFVYGTLKQGFRNHRFIEGAALLDANYAMMNAKLLHLGGFPGLVTGDGTVYGELYEITEDMLPALDRLEGVPYLYTREQADDTRLLPGNASVHFYEYAGNGGHTEPVTVIESGRWE